MATLLRRGIVETIGSGLGNGASGTTAYDIPVEATGARIALQAFVSGSPTSWSIPVLISLDGVNFAALALATLSNTSDFTVVVSQGVAAIKVGAVSITGGTSPAATVLARVA